MQSLELSNIFHLKNLFFEEDAGKPVASQPSYCSDQSSATIDLDMTSSSS
jgi:hypothetical protein